MEYGLSGGNAMRDLALIALIAVAVWAVVELALTLRKTRRTVDELAHSATETIDQVQPIIAKLDGVIDELQPTIGEVQPLVEKVELTVDEANVSFAKVNGILGDVSELSGAASSVTSSVKSAAAAATNGVQDFVDRMVGGPSHAERVSALSEAQPKPAALDVAPTQESSPVATTNYITYGDGRVEADDGSGSGVSSDADTTSELPIISGGRARGDASGAGSSDEKE